MPRKAYYWKNPEIHRAAARDYGQRNREKIGAKKKEHRKQATQQGKEEQLKHDLENTGNGETLVLRISRECFEEIYRHGDNAICSCSEPK